jgi:polyferredoxin
MHKIGKPRGLIDYMALSDEVRERNGEASRGTWSHIFRTRTVLYTALWALVGVGLIVALFVRPNIEFTVAPVRNPIFVTLSDGSIRNTYDIRLRNKNPEERMFEISLTGNLAFGLSLDDTPYASVAVPADSTLLQRVFVTAPAGSDPATAEFTDLRFWIEDLTNGDRAFKDTTFNGDDR